MNDDDSPWRIRDAARRLPMERTSEAGRELAGWRYRPESSGPAPMPAVALAAGATDLALLIWGVWSALPDDEPPAPEPEERPPGRAGDSRRR